MERPRQFRLYALLLFAAANLLHYANRSVMLHTRMYDDLRAAFDLSNAELGLLGTTAFMVPHGIATLFVGWLGDRLDRRRVLVFGLLVWSGAATLAPWASGMPTLFALRALQGVGCAACVPVVNAMLGRLFEARGRARAISVFNLGLFLGGVVGFSVGWLYGFPRGFVIVAVPGFLIAILVWLLPLPERVATFRVEKPERWAVVQSVLGRPALRRMYVGGILMAFAAGGYLAWFSEFLEKVKGMPTGQSSTLFGFCMVGGLAGVLSGGALADAWLKRTRAARQFTVCAGFLCALPCAILAIQLPAGVPFYIASCLLMFFINWYHAPIAAGVDEQVEPEHAATAQGVYVFLMHFCGTAPSGAVVGEVADRIGLLHALYVPTAAIAGAALAFFLAAKVVQKEQS